MAGIFFVLNCLQMTAHFILDELSTHKLRKSKPSCVALNLLVDSVQVLSKW